MKKPFRYYAEIFCAILFTLCSTYIFVINSAPNTSSLFQGKENTIFSLLFQKINFFDFLFFKGINLKLILLIILLFYFYVNFFKNFVNKHKIYFNLFRVNTNKPFYLKIKIWIKRILWSLVWVLCLSLTIRILLRCCIFYLFSDWVAYTVILIILSMPVSIYILNLIVKWYYKNLELRDLNLFNDSVANNINVYNISIIVFINYIVKYGYIMSIGITCIMFILVFVLFIVMLFIVIPSDKVSKWFAVLPSKYHTTLQSSMGLESLAVFAGMGLALAEEINHCYENLPYLFDSSDQENLEFSENSNRRGVFNFNLTIPTNYTGQIGSSLINKNVGWDLTKHLIDSTNLKQRGYEYKPFVYYQSPKFVGSLGKIGDTAIAIHVRKDLAQLKNLLPSYYMDSDKTNSQWLKIPKIKALDTLRKESIKTGFDPYDFKNTKQVIIFSQMVEVYNDRGEIVPDVKALYRLNPQYIDVFNEYAANNSGNLKTNYMVPKEKSNDFWYKEENQKLIEIIRRYEWFNKKPDYEFETFLYDHLKNTILYKTDPSNSVELSPRDFEQTKVIKREDLKVAYSLVESRLLDLLSILNPNAPFNFEGGKLISRLISSRHHMMKSDYIQSPNLSLTLLNVDKLSGELLIITNIKGLDLFSLIPYNEDNRGDNLNTNYNLNSITTRYVIKQTSNILNRKDVQNVWNLYHKAGANSLQVRYV